MYNRHIRFIILHYTNLPFEESLDILRHTGVSAHFLVPKEPKVPVVKIVEMHERAHHAGVSAWQSTTNLNDCSVGIEIVNYGFGFVQENQILYYHHVHGHDHPRHDQFMNIDPCTLYALEKTGKISWDPYPDHQIDILISLLKEITENINILPVAITGHADIAPNRKQDPGPKFPWKKLAAAGIGAWPDDEAVSKIHTLRKNKKIDIAWLQNALKTYGYRIDVTNTLDQQTKEVLVAFQMHFRPENYSGHPDTETCSILEALLQKHYKS